VNSSPPRIIRPSAGRVRVNVVTVAESEVNDAPHDGGLLIGSPGVVEPVVGEGEGGRELGEVEPVKGVPVVAGGSEVLASGGVTGGGLRGRRKGEGEKGGEGESGKM
jgi:hypothetical protein